MKIVILAQHLAPKQAMTALAGKLAHQQFGRLTTRFIQWFVKRYQVNMQEAEHSDMGYYKTFNQFFTRPLKANARPMAKAKWICPVDGRISQFGPIEADQIFQAKGHSYSTQALLADVDAAKHYQNGTFACLYLSPKDYHRIHMPCDAQLLNMRYVPGSLYSVNPLTAENIAGLFARNERVVCHFQSETHGRFVMVLVGATIVGSMATVWHVTKEGIINPPRTKAIQSWDYADQMVKLKQGEEMGRFLLGSTVVMLFESGQCEFNPDWSASKAILLGEAMSKS